MELAVSCLSRTSGHLWSIGKNIDSKRLFLSPSALLRHSLYTLAAVLLLLLLLLLCRCCPCRCCHCWRYSAVRTIHAKHWLMLQPDKQRPRVCRLRKSTASAAEPQATTSHKPQATSHKPQAISQATSHKPQADKETTETRDKRQETRDKQLETTIQ